MTHPRAHGLPPIDERLVAPGTRFEILDGRLLYVRPARRPHATRHSKLSALLEAYAASGYEAASDMLTRASETTDIAPDASVFPKGKDPETGGRRLERLAFEIISNQRLSVPTRKAAALATRGVAQVFLIDVKRSRALAWSRETETWQMLARDAVIEDPALALPLPVEALVSASTEDAVAAALIAKKNRVLHAAIERARGEARAEGKAEGRAEGKAEAKAEAILAVLRGRGLRVPVAIARRVRATTDARTLSRWLRRAVTCTSGADLVC